MLQCALDREGQHCRAATWSVWRNRGHKRQDIVPKPRRPDGRRDDEARRERRKQRAARLTQAGRRCDGKERVLHGAVVSSILAWMPLGLVSGRSPVLPVLQNSVTSRGERTEDVEHPSRTSVRYVMPRPRLLVGGIDITVSQ